MLCACYRKDEAVNPEVYAAAVEAVLSDYPREVIEYVTDPRTGLPKRCAWLPSIKEVHDMCGEITELFASRERRKRALEQQFKDRDQYEDEQARKRALRFPEQ